MNEQIRLSPVRLIDADGVQRDIMPTSDALAMAREAGLDLVEVSPNERPPVCKIMDYGKQKYLQSKKQKQKHHEQRLKELRIRPKTDPHDKEIKISRARRFLESGDRVQFTMMFRGRERLHREVGLRIFDEIVSLLQDVSKIERHARMLGRRMTMVLVPLKAGATKKAKPPKATVEPKDADGTSAESPGSGILDRAAMAMVTPPRAQPMAQAPPPESHASSEGPAP
ncbi:MAG: translation initiation factor IF-3 [Phycisphaerae bacterium]|nr:translation initiation factor IF-3 [Phycisphaerae bacterium]